MDGDLVDADADDNGVCLLEMENQLICSRKQNAKTQNAFYKRLFVKYSAAALPHPTGAATYI